VNREADRAKLHERLRMGRGAFTVLPKSERAIIATLLDTDFRAMAVEYHAELEKRLSPGEFAVYVYREGLSELADAGRWDWIAARLFYRLEELDGRTLAKALRFDGMIAG